VITLSPQTNSKCTIPWAVTSASVGWELVQKGLHRSPPAWKSNPDWNMATPLCSVLELSHSHDPHFGFQRNLVSFTVHWQFFRSSKSKFSCLLSLFTSPNNPVPSTSCVSQLHCPSNHQPTSVGYYSLLSEFSHIPCVPHGNIQSGHVHIVREVLEFIKDKGKEFHRPWCN
jgi:hypothetical protein